MPTPFAKIIDLPTHQVLFFKDWEEINDETSYRVECRIEVFPGTLQACSYGYQREAKRDAFFDRLNEEAAQMALNLLQAPFLDAE